MIWHGCISIAARMEPDLVASSGLSVKLKATRLQLVNDLSISKSRQAPHLGRDHDRVVLPLTSGWQVWKAAPLTPSLYEFSRDVARDLQRLSHSPSLRDKAWELIGSREEQALRQFLDVYANRQFHTS